LFALGLVCETAATRRRDLSAYRHCIEAQPEFPGRPHFTLWLIFCKRAAISTPDRFLSARDALRSQIRSARIAQALTSARKGRSGSTQLDAGACLEGLEALAPEREISRRRDRDVKANVSRDLSR